ncbi:hypothetical protein [Streptomyces sp. NPDC049585]|uniref:hypothetical protein n=1 Tax=Streptomyces sp. NPDC049585 TaxID=3155154 RepID=UPI003439BDE8
MSTRAARPYPVYWAAVLISATVISIWPAVQHIDNWTQVALNLTKLQHGSRPGSA